jgi:cellobiose phosphorylase
MEYGYFDDHNREYVIIDPRTPVKWINYIGTLAFGGLVDHTGGALLCKGDPALNRITKYIPQLPASSFKGTTLYLRLRDGDGYRVFSPYYVPTLDSYDHYQCRIGLGYTRIISEFYHVRTDVTIFVPVGGRQEIRDIRITNLSDRPLEIDVIPVVEYTHPDALKQFTNADWIPQTMQSQIMADPEGHKILLQYPFMLKEMRVNYLTSSRPVSSFESDRPRFLGDHEYGTWAAPQSLQQPELSSYEARRGDNVGALLHHLGELEPGATQQLITQLGQVESIEAALEEVQRYRDPAQVQAALDELRGFWDSILARQQVRTPDPDMDRMLNVHNPRQCYVTKQWSRYLSLYQLGLGARGIGFRDSSQDVMGVVPLVPEEAKALMEMLLQVQKRDGSAMHQFNPLTMIGNEGDSRDEERPKYYSDDHLWIVLAVTTYLKETGDLGFLEQVIPFYGKDRDERPIEAGTVLEHLRRALAFTQENVGRHKLPLAGFADWNDTVNLLTGAESLFTANLYGTALREMIQLVGHLGDDATADRYRAWYEEMGDRVNTEAWDGGWYVRYFDADGSPIGSHTNQEGQIFTNGQSWPVISGFATPERARLALDAVYARLNTRNGVKLSAPGYDGFDPLKGGVTTYPPGAKENGGIFLHANPWVIIAETILGEGNRAFEYYEQMNPAAKNDRIDEFECEPYVYPQNILGDEHPQFGLARNSWLTGTASWAYQAATKYILGIRPTYRGLEVDPCIPARWDGFSVRREFRGATYEIIVSNPAHVCRGVRRLWVDGEEVQGNRIPLLGDGQVHQVEVVLEE